MIYRFQKQNNTMSAERVALAFLELEKKLRTSELVYTEPRLTKKQLAAIQSSWSKELFETFRTKVKALTPPETPISPVVAYQVVVQILKEDLFKSIHQNSAKSIYPSTLKKAIASDIALSTVFDEPFSTSFDGTKTIQNHQVIVKNMVASDRMVIECDKVNEAELYVFALYNEELDKSILVGWKAQKEVRLHNRGNKNTDNQCRWNEMSYYFNYQEFNPMINLLRQLGVQKAYDGVLLETITDPSDIPFPNNKLNDILSSKSTDAGDSFYSMLGMEDTTTKKIEKKEQKIATSDNDLEF